MNHTRISQDTYEVHSAESALVVPVVLIGANFSAHVDKKKWTQIKKFVPTPKLHFSTFHKHYWIPKILSFYVFINFPNSASSVFDAFNNIPGNFSSTFSGLGLLTVITQSILLKQDNTIGEFV